MSYEFLQTLWFILIAVLWIGFYFLEGFDFGVGMLLPFLGKKDEERRAIINAIGSTWDGNEVWLLTAGGATFAAFPHWYATMFSGFYLPLFLLLVGLILRGISFEYRSKNADPKWRNRFDWMIAIGSFMASLLLGTAFANLAKGAKLNLEIEIETGYGYSPSEERTTNTVGTLVLDAIFYAALGTLRREFPPHGIGKLYFADNWEDAANFQPDVYLDISAVFEKWMQACDAFPMWRGQTGFFRYNDYYRSLAVMRGCLSGFRHAVALMSDPNDRLNRVRTLV